MVAHVLTDMNECVSYDYSSSHQALDIIGCGGTVSDVMAFADGVVEIVVNDVMYTNHNTTGTATYGNFIKIRHADGHKTLYAHLEYGSILVKAGDTVSKGQKIATMGATGNAYGVHLHFEVRMSNEVRENPMEYLTGQKTFSVPVLGESTEDPEEETEIEKEPENIVEETEEEVIISNSSMDEEANLQDSEVEPSANNVVSPKEHIKNSTYKGGSIVDGLKDIGYDSSYNYRAKIAYINGIDNYRGTYNQNVYLLSLLKQGKLIKA